MAAEKALFGWSNYWKHATQLDIQWLNKASEEDGMASYSPPLSCIDYDACIHSGGSSDLTPIRTAATIYLFCQRLKEREKKKKVHFTVPEKRRENFEAKHIPFSRWDNCWHYVTPYQSCYNLIKDDSLKEPVGVSNECEGKKKVFIRLTLEAWTLFL